MVLLDHAQVVTDEADRDAILHQSSNPRVGAVRAVVVDDEYAIVLDDLRSDHRDIELRAYRLGRSGWRQIFGQDDFAILQTGATLHGGWAINSQHGGGYGWTLGRDLPGTIVTLRLRDDLIQVSTNHEGWWLCIRETDDRAFDAPYRVS